MAAEKQAKLKPTEIITDLRRRVGYFRENERLRPGDADSAHGVIFGELSDLGSVAVKPFWAGKPRTATERARGEMKSLQRIQGAGFEAIEPITVAKGALATYLITRRRGGLRHLGQVDWTGSVASRNLQQVVAPTLHNAASTLLDWHNAGVFNGDAQVKNLAYDKRTGASVFTDAERAQFSPDASRSVQHGNKDLELFGISVLARGMLADRSPIYRAGYLAENLLDPYLGAVMYPNQSMNPEERRGLIISHWVQALRSNSTLPTTPRAAPAAAGNRVA